MSELILLELIKAMGIVLAAGVPSVAVLLVNKSRQKNECLKRDLRNALSDLRFMLAVEAEHSKMWQEESGKSNVLLVRKVVHARDQLDWSGAFHKKRLIKKLEQLS